MKNNKKILVMSTLLMAIVLLGVGTIAYFRRAVNGNITGNTGILVFNVNGLTGETSETLEYSLNRSEEEPYVYPGDSGYFDLEITAEGSSTDVYVTLDIIRDHLPDNLKFYTTEDHKSVINTRYIFFEKTGEMSETRRIYWYWDGTKDDINDSLFINQTLSARITLSATPMEYGMMKNGSIVDNTEFWQSQYRYNISSISFSNDFSGMPDECTEDNLCFDISYEENQRYPVYAYLIENESDLYDLYIVCTKTVFAPVNSSYLFASFRKLQTINFNNWFNTSKVGSMRRMFDDNYSLLELDVSDFNTTQVIDFSSMFSLGIEEDVLTELNLGNFDTRNAVDMNYMFAWCDNLTTLNLESFDTSNVTDMSGMFVRCKNLTMLNLDSFNTTNVRDMSYMFDGCSSLTSLNLSSFNTTNVNSMSYIFNSCEYLTTELTISNPNCFLNGFYYIAMQPGTQLTLNYINETSSLVDEVIRRKSADENIVKGKLISTPKTYTITLEDTSVTYEVDNANLYEGTRVVLMPNESNKYISSFKVNGETITGNDFNLTSNAVISDVVMYNVNIDSDVEVVSTWSNYENTYAFTGGYIVNLFEIEGVLATTNYFYIKDGTTGDINISILEVQEDLGPM